MALNFIAVTVYFVLSVIFQVKHFVADYLLQNEYMLGKFKEKDWVKPLAAHCGVHGFMTFCILTALCPWMSWALIIFLTLLDMIIHFCMDRIKASPNMLGKFQSLTKDDVIKHQEAMKEVSGSASSELAIKWENRKKNNALFWWSLGADQLVHHLTHELVVYIAVLSLILGM